LDVHQGELEAYGIKYDFDTEKIYSPNYEFIVRELASIFYVKLF